jgi:hypothetical protein
VCDTFAAMGSFRDASYYIKTANPSLDEVGVSYLVVSANQTLRPNDAPFWRGRPPPK